MALVKTKSKANGRCYKGSRHRSGKKGCWRPSMSGKRK